MRRMDIVASRTRIDDCHTPKYPSASVIHIPRIVIVFRATGSPQPSLTTDHIAVLKLGPTQCDGTNTVTPQSCLPNNSRLKWTSLSCSLPGDMTMKFAFGRPGVVFAPELFHVLVKLEYVVAYPEVVLIRTPFLSK